MQKTFCDKCNQEIEANDGELTKFVIEVSCEEEDQHGEIETTTKLKADLCVPCSDEVGVALARVGLKT